MSYGVLDHATQPTYPKLHPSHHICSLSLSLAATMLTAPQRNPSVWLECVNCFFQASLNFSPHDNELF